MIIIMYKVPNAEAMCLGGSIFIYKNYLFVNVITIEKRVRISNIL